MAAPERLQQPKPSRPVVVSQHSNSVPSTPAQHPRDIRFPSRSPSPSRTLSNHSPKSTASETPNRNPAQRSTPVVCKFESGAEFRKRRIPYKDGGNEPLSPPEKEPKKALTPDEEDKLSGDMRELYDRLLPSKESDQRRVNLVTKLEEMLNKEWPDSNIKVNVFGSSGNLLSSDDSDVDLCITTPLRKLESMHSLATVLHDHGMQKVICRASAKVPIVKFWDPELQLACDMNVNNPLALENTRMIKTYVQIDERVRPLAKIIKHWTKRRILNDAAFGGTISSYTWICMIINFLQSRDPPILPSLQRMPQSRQPKTGGEVSAFADDLCKLRGWGKENKQSLGDLLFSFFRFYGYEFDYQENVVSVKEGRVLSRTEKRWDTRNAQHDKEARSRLCVEEPFNPSRNLGNSADDYAFSGIHEEIRRAFDLIAQNKLDECCQQFEFPIEEKPLFQRPTPKPKPILTRSASQTGRPHALSTGSKGEGRQSRNHRNASTQRSNNRRASSGASYGNQRHNFMSPAVNVGGNDYFATAPMSTDQLHEQLYKQYQFLQQQQEALRNQLLQQQQAHAAAQAQAQAQAQTQSQAYSTASPRRGQFSNALPSPRMAESPQAMAPLLPGYLYHYPARYPPPASPLAQTRTNNHQPSSPSHAATMPALRRGSNRSQLPDMPATSSIRSQSQPGRSLQNPLTVQSQAHPGFDTSGAIGQQYVLQRSMPLYAQQNGLDLASPVYVTHPGNLPTDTPMPKEYVGYYLGHSPQMAPQYPATNPTVVPILHDLPHHPRRLSPERLPPILPNGMRRQSRSPSPLSKGHGSPTSTASRSAPLPQMPFPEAARQGNGPIIANGSNRNLNPPAIVSSSGSRPQNLQAAQGLGLSSLPVSSESGMLHPSSIPELPRPIDSARILDRSKEMSQQADHGNKSAWNTVTRSNPSNAQVPPVNGSTSHHENDGAPPSASRTSPGLRANIPARLNLSPSEQLLPDTTPPAVERKKETPPMVSAPLLSPVAELRTPSPTTSKILSSPKKEVTRASQGLNGSLNERTNAIIANGTAKAATAATSEPKKPTPAIQQQPSVNGNQSQQVSQWQQATRKGHKKGKSTGNMKGPGVMTGGEPMPANEKERKGG